MCREQLNQQEFAPVAISGQFNTAICFARDLEEKATAQIAALCGFEEFADSKIRIMPDAHAGKGCVIGTTMTITDKIVPALVGVDIGCGMEVAQIAAKDLDFKALDKVIHKRIPSGREVRKPAHPANEEVPLEDLRCFQLINEVRARRSVGTLGGGNHFIEMNRDQDDNFYLVIHSGSRHLGTEVAELYQAEAWHELCGNSKKQLEEAIAELKKAGRQQDISAMLAKLRRRSGPAHLPEDLAYAQGALFADYLHDMKLVQAYAVLNRRVMTEIILKAMDWTAVDRFTTIHNYIDTDSMILRKGSVSAKAGERFLLPINMRDGSYICKGKGNPDWNYSAPHGAGRAMSRGKAYKTLSVEDYKEQMAGVFSTSVNGKTLDEAPMAYKNKDAILSCLAPTAEIMTHLQSVYNFKALV